MNKALLILIGTALAISASAFPVVTNRLYITPGNSTGQFDDFLLRWSGFDDQRVEMFI